MEVLLQYNGIEQLQAQLKSSAYHLSTKAAQRIMHEHKIAYLALLYHIKKGQEPA